MSTPSFIWSELREHSRDERHGSVVTVPSTASCEYGRVRFAIGSHGEPRLLVPVSGEMRRTQKFLSRGINAQYSMLTMDGISYRVIDLVCTDGELVNAFEQVCKAIENEILAGTESDKAVFVTLDKFSTLFGKQPSGAIDPNTLIGVIGELIVLNTLCAKLSNPHLGWMGPSGQRHDFEFRNLALEVKTTTKIGANTLKINGLHQLEFVEGKGLYLINVRVERSADGEITIGSLVENIVKKGISRIELCDRLAKLGIHDPEDYQLNSNAFSLAGITAYLVSDEFPRIDSGNFVSGVLPNGVTGLTYDLELRKLAIFECPLEAVLDDARLNDFNEECNGSF